MTRIAFRMIAAPGVTLTAEQARQLVGSVQLIPPGLYICEHAEVLDDGAGLWVVLTRIGTDS